MKEEKFNIEAEKTLNILDGLSKAEPEIDIYENVLSIIEDSKAKVSVRFIQIAAAFLVILNFSLFGINYSYNFSNEYLDELGSEYFEDQMDLSSIEISN